IGRSFDEIAKIIDGVTHNERLSVCLDTCHIHDAGYDIVNDFDGVLNDFDKIIGAERIKVVHVNDSKNEREAHKDRHENIGFGYIGFDALHYVINHPQFKDLPKILETPYVGEDKKNKKPPYKYEIEMIKKGEFMPDLKKQIMEQ
ncbi:MAG TPA: deoxyribonuclease IV, partial [Pseudogracilibacillus sp.]|nr:deoxyribonuclease IV [Pseudogracilibacillus sp.]